MDWGRRRIKHRFEGENVVVANGSRYFLRRGGPRWKEDGRWVNFLDAGYKYCSYCRVYLKREDGAEFSKCPVCGGSVRSRLRERLYRSVSYISWPYGDEDEVVPNGSL